MANRKLIFEREFSVAPNHTPRSITVGWTPLDEGSAGRRDLYFYEKFHKSQISTRPAGLEPGISAREPPHNYNLDWLFTFIPRINNNDEKFQLFG